jgi:riboflavin synthase
MFTGIIEQTGTVKSIEARGSNLIFSISAMFLPELKVDQSVAHNGVCLTITDIDADAYSVTAVAETLTKTNLGNLRVGDTINLERCMPANGRFDGHFVQGHVDALSECIHIQDMDGSWLFTFAFDHAYAGLLVEKGSITLNGVSLTIFNITGNTFQVAIIPYTFAHTSFKHLHLYDKVNTEFDILGKYIQRQLNLQSNSH